MAEHSNVALWRQVHKAFSQGDLETLRTYFTDDVVCRIGGSHPLSGERRGIGGLLAYVQALTEMAGGTLRLEPHDVMATDEHIVALVRLSATSGGRPLHWNAAAIYHVRDGKISQIETISPEQIAIDEIYFRLLASRPPSPSPARRHASSRRTTHRAGRLASLR